MADEIKKDLKKPPKGQAIAAIGEELDISAGTLENPNDFFGRTDKDIVLQCREMDNIDPILYGLFQTRKLSILSLKREIIGEGQEADYVRDNFAGIPNFHNKFSQILNAIKCGVAIIEIIWDEWEGGKWGIYDLLPRYQSKFIFRRNPSPKIYIDELRLLTEKKSEEGEVCLPFKYGVMTYDEEYGNRYGNALYQKIYYQWFYKKNATKFWSIYTERFASPIPKFTPEGAVDSKDEVTIKKFIKNIKSSTGILLPPGVALELLQAMQGGAESYEKFINQQKDEIAIAIVGQPSTVQSGGTGSYARDKVREKITRGDILGADIKMCETFFNDEIIKPLVDFNFPNVTEYPKWRINKGVIADLGIMIRVVEGLLKAGTPITQNYIFETFGIPIPREGDKLLKAYQAPIGKQFSDVNSVIEEIQKLGII